MSVNKSKTYVLPYMTDYIDLKFVQSIINTYLFYNGEYKFCILYKFSGKKEFTDYEDSLLSNPLFDTTVDVSTDQVLYVFDIPDDMYDIIETFIEGKYSRLPNKNKIKNFLIDHFNLSHNNIIFHVLDRSEVLREKIEGELNIEIDEELDLSDPPNVEAEEFKLEFENEYK